MGLRRGGGCPTGARDRNLGAVPSLIELVIHPDRRKPAPEPVPVSLGPAFVAGSGLWALALGVMVVWPGFEISMTAVATCVMGVALGGLGLIWSRRQR